MVFGVEGGLSRGRYVAPAVAGCAFEAAEGVVAVGEAGGLESGVLSAVYLRMVSREGIGGKVGGLPHGVFLPVSCLTASSCLSPALR